MIDLDALESLARTMPIYREWKWDADHNCLLYSDAPKFGWHHVAHPCAEHNALVKWAAACDPPAILELIEMCRRKP